MIHAFPNMDLDGQLITEVRIGVITKSAGVPSGFSF
jgi:hypothetical protein